MSHYWIQKEGMTGGLWKGSRESEESTEELSLAYVA